MKGKENANEVFQRMVDERGAALRRLSPQELMAAGEDPEVVVKIQGRRGTICNIVE